LRGFRTRTLMQSTLPLSPALFIVRSITSLRLCVCVCVRGEGARGERESARTVRVCVERVHAGRVDRAAPDSAVRDCVRACLHVRHAHQAHSHAAVREATEGAREDERIAVCRRGAGTTLATLQHACALTWLSAIYPKHTNESDKEISRLTGLERERARESPLPPRRLFPLLAPPRTTLAPSPGTMIPSVQAHAHAGSHAQCTQPARPQRSVTRTPATLTLCRQTWRARRR